MVREFDMFSEIKPYVAIFTGGLSIATLNVIFAAIGAGGIVWGGYMAHKRWQEQRRTNDIEYARLEWEKEKDAKGKNSPQTVAVREEEANKDSSSQA